jgi:hypothetical protein
MGQQGNIVPLVKDQVTKITRKRRSRAKGHSCLDLGIALGDLGLMKTDGSWS